MAGRTKPRKEPQKVGKIGSHNVCVLDSTVCLVIDTGEQTAGGKPKTVWLSMTKVKAALTAVEAMKQFVAQYDGVKPSELTGKKPSTATKPFNPEQKEEADELKASLAQMREQMAELTDKLNQNGAASQNSNGRFRVPASSSNGKAH